MNQNKNPKGMALVMALLVLIVISITALSIASVSLKERTASIGESQSSIAFQNAQSGMEKVMNEIKLMSSNDVDSLTCKSDDIYEVLLFDEDEEIDCDEIDDAGDIARITRMKSIGMGRGVQRAIEVGVNPSSVACTDPDTDWEPVIDTAAICSTETRSQTRRVNCVIQTQSVWGTKDCSTAPSCITIWNPCANNSECCAGLVCWKPETSETEMCLPPPICQGNLPSNTKAHDAEEETGLTVNTNWSYSLNDTPTKCQYECKDGYKRVGSSCVLSGSGSSGEMDCHHNDASYYFETLTANVGGNQVCKAKVMDGSLKFYGECDPYFANINVVPGTFSIGGKIYTVPPAPYSSVGSVGFSSNIIMPGSCPSPRPNECTQVSTAEYSYCSCGNNLSIIGTRTRYDLCEYESAPSTPTTPTTLKWVSHTDMIPSPGCTNENPQKLCANAPMPIYPGLSCTNQWAVVECKMSPEEQCKVYRCE